MHSVKDDIVPEITFKMYIALIIIKINNGDHFIYNFTSITNVTLANILPLIYQTYNRPCHKEKAFRHIHRERSRHKHARRGSDSRWKKKIGILHVKVKATRAHRTVLENHAESRPPLPSSANPRKFVHAKRDDRTRVNAKWSYKQDWLVRFEWALREVNLCGTVL